MRIFAIPYHLFRNQTYQVFDRNCRLVYITESADWIIRWVGHSILEELKNKPDMRGLTSEGSHAWRGKILHFGSINMFLKSNGFVKPHPSNKVVVTWFHVVPGDPRLRFVRDAITHVDVVHTASTKTKQELIRLGVPDEKIVVIPLGVDLNVFKPVDHEEKMLIRNEFGLPKDKIVIGSFQKDGNGWGEGLEPKWVKGPDIFCDVVERLSKQYNLHVLLTGPARGYVRQRLEKMGVTYTHEFLENYLNINRYYQALDLYIVSSRVEGGPMAFLECWAAGVPFVTTRVGMADDLLHHGEDALVVEGENRETLAAAVQSLIENKDLFETCRQNGLKEVQNHGWKNIAERYYTELYKPLL